MEIQRGKDGFVLHAGRERRCKPCWTLLITLLLSLLAVGLWFYYSGYLGSVSESEDGDGSGIALTLKGQVDRYRGLLETEKTENDRLSIDLIEARRVKELEEQTNTEMRKQIFALEQELSDAKDELVLYEGILSSDDLKAGLHIKHFELRMRAVSAAEQEGDSDNKRQYRYHLVLVMVRGGDNNTQGSFDIRFSGELKGKKIKKTHQDWQLTEKGEIKAESQFSFKYYQSFTGIIEFPDDFVLEEVRVRATPSTNGLRRVEQTYKREQLEL